MIKFNLLVEKKENIKKINVAVLCDNAYFANKWIDEHSYKFNNNIIYHHVTDQIQMIGKRFEYFIKTEYYSSNIKNEDSIESLISNNPNIKEIC